MSCETDTTLRGTMGRGYCCIERVRVLRRALRHASNAFLMVLDTYTLADLIKPQRALSSLLLDWPRSFAAHLTTGTTGLLRSKDAKSGNHWHNSGYQRVVRAHWSRLLFWSAAETVFISLLNIGPRRSCPRDQVAKGGDGCGDEIAPQMDK